MERVTLIVPWLKSISPHFKPNNSLCRNPVVAARSTSVRSRIAKPLTNALISAGVRIIGARAAFRALTNEVDWVTIKQLISAGMIEENGHEISDFGTAAFCQWQSAKPRLNLNGSNLAKLASLPMRPNPSGQVRMVDFFRGMAAPNVFLCEFALLEMITKLSNGHCPGISRLRIRVDFRH